jgi:hypothetical protein
VSSEQESPSPTSSTKRRGRQVPTQLIVDDFGEARIWRRCAICKTWKPQAIGSFSPRQRDDKKRVIKWDARCLPCRATYRRENWAKMTRKQRSAVARRRWEQIKADPEALAEKRQRTAERMRSPEYRERRLQATKAYYRRVMADPEKRAAYLERARMNYRLRQERKGRSLDSIGSKSTVARSEEKVVGYLPAKPLADKVAAYLATTEVDDSKALAAIGVEPRSFFAWRTGERQVVQVLVADMAITHLGLNWWDIWPPERYTEAERIFARELATA